MAKFLVVHFHSRRFLSMVDGLFDIYLALSCSYIYEAACPFRILIPDLERSQGLSIGMLGIQGALAFQWSIMMRR
jgi:hypothetical protein